jgi:hypothetical protein
VRLLEGFEREGRVWGNPSMGRRRGQIGAKVECDTRSAVPRGMQKRPEGSIYFLGPTAPPVLSGALPPGGPLSDLDRGLGGSVGELRFPQDASVQKGDDCLWGPLKPWASGRDGIRRIGVEGESLALCTLLFSPHL